MDEDEARLICAGRLLQGRQRVGGSDDERGPARCRLRNDLVEILRQHIATFPTTAARIATAAASSRTSLIAREGSSRVACVAVCLAPNGQIVSQVHASRVMSRVPGVHAIRRSPSLIPDPMSTRCRRRPIAMVLVSTAIAYPHPSHARRSGRRRSGQQGGVYPNLPAHSRRTSIPPDPVHAFAQVTGLRAQNLMTAETGPFSIPPPGIKRGPRTTFPQVIPVGAGPCQDLGDLRFGLSSVAARTSR